jgi:beta-phosphoglucomutase-like phosphatase (HAD superfamily)
MLRKPVEAALFDMDGLLLDTEAIYIEAMREAVRALGHRELPLDFCRSTTGVPGPERNRMIEAHYGEGFSIAEFREQFAVLARRRMDAGIPVKAGVVELLDFLASHPDVYLEAARRLGVAPERCLAFEDSNVGLEAAHAAGTMAFMVPDLLQPLPENRERSVEVFPDLHAALRVLRQHLQ